MKENAALMQNRIRSFQGLRFVMIIFLFLHHLDAFNDLNLPDWSDIFSWMDQGYFSVNFFYILSGFVVTLGYGQKIREKTITRRRFMLNRFAHIWPTYMLILMGSLLIYNGFHLGNVLSQFTNPVLWANILMVQAWIPDVTMTAAFSYNGVAWSVSTEWFFYFSFLFLARIDKRDRHALTAGLWIFIVWCIWTVNPAQYALWTWPLYINPLFRMADFLLGMLLYDFYSESKLKPKTRGIASTMEIGSVLLLAVFVFAAVKLKSIGWPWRWQVFYTVPIALLLYAFCYQKGILSKILGSRVLVWLGEAAMPLFLLHQIVLNICKWNALEWLISIKAVLLLSAIAFVIALTLAVIIQFGFSKPVNKLIRSKLHY